MSLRIVLAFGFVLAMSGDVWADGMRPTDVAHLETVESPDVLAMPDPPELREKLSLASTSPKVRYARYPLPLYDAYFTAWGPPTVHSNGKVYSALGDHRGRRGDCYIYEFDPDTECLRCVANLQQATPELTRADFGFGKIHGRMSEGPDGCLYFSSWWGPETEDSDLFKGERVFRFDPETNLIEDMGIPAFGWGAPSTRLYGPDMLLYGETNERLGNSQGDPNKDFLTTGYKSWDDNLHTRFMVYDLRNRRLKFLGGHEGTSAGRDFFVDAGGNAYFNNGKGKLQRYDRIANTVSSFPLTMPDRLLRRAAGPDPNGVYYGVTKEKHIVFRFDPSKPSIETVAELPWEVSAFDLDPSGQSAYYVSLHSDMQKSSVVALIRLDLRSGRQTVIALLDKPIKSLVDQRLFKPKATAATQSQSVSQTQQAKTMPASQEAQSTENRNNEGYFMGGRYGLAISRDGRSVYMPINGVIELKDKWKACPLFVVVELPQD